MGPRPSYSGNAELGAQRRAPQGAGCTFGPGLGCKLQRPCLLSNRLRSSLCPPPHFSLPDDLVQGMPAVGTMGTSESTRSSRCGRFPFKNVLSGRERHNREIKA